MIGAVFGDLDVSNEAFAFMEWRDTTFAGVPVRVGRVSFSGELAFEVNVAAGYARAVWDALIESGTQYGITPYGTETMHVLRAEKGYPIIGQDTDGTVTPHDLGLGWAVSKKKPDFIGKRSYTRQSHLDPDRKQLVGLLPVDATTRLPEGSQVIEQSPDRTLPPASVPMLGHVTSSYDSAELGRPFALALVGGGTGRIGTRLDVPVGERLAEVEVTSPCSPIPKEPAAMAEPTFRTPLAGWSDRFAALAPAVLVAETPVAQISVRSTDPAVIEALGLPGVCSVGRQGDGTGRSGSAPTVDSHPAGCRGPRLAADAPGDCRRRPVRPGRHLSHRCERPAHPADPPRPPGGNDSRARLLNRPLPTRFGDTTAVQTLLAQAGVVLHRDGDGFALYVRSSFADYLAAWIVDAAIEYTTVPPR